MLISQRLLDRNSSSFSLSFTFFFFLQENRYLHIHITMVNREITIIFRRGRVSQLLKMQYTIHGPAKRITTRLPSPGHHQNCVFVGVSTHQQALLLVENVRQCMEYFIYVYICILTRSIVVRVISRLRMILLEPEVSREEVMQIPFFFVSFLFQLSLLISRLFMVTWAQIAAAATCVRSNHCLFLLSVSFPTPLTEESDLEKRENVIPSSFTDGKVRKTHQMGHEDEDILPLYAL